LSFSRHHTYIRYWEIIFALTAVQPYFCLVYLKSRVSISASRKAAKKAKTQSKTLNGVISLRLMY